MNVHYSFENSPAVYSILSQSVPLSQKCLPFLKVYFNIISQEIFCSLAFPNKILYEFLAYSVPFML